MSIDGPWLESLVLDRHVISSVPIGYLGEHMQFGTTRCALGELVYQLKYQNGPLNDIVDTAVAFVNEPWNSAIDCVVSPPPPLHRTKQPAVLIAAGIDLGEGVAGRHPAFAAVRADFRHIAVLLADVHAGYHPSPISRDRAQRRMGHRGTARPGETFQCSHARV